MALPTYRYPLDLGDKADTLPFVQFRIIKYNERTLIKDAQRVSSLAEAYTSPEVRKLDQNIQDSIKKLDPSAQAFYEKNKQSIINSASNPYEIQELSNIFLPLPENLQNTYSPQWNMEDMIILNGIRDTIDALAGGDIGQAIKSGAGGVLAAASSNNGGLLSQKIGALTPNPKKQALFTGIEPRNFVFEYVFSAQSKQEAEVIEGIVKTLNRYSLPSLEDPRDAFYKFPAEFSIKFHNVKGFPDISWCVCKGISTNYAPGSMQILESGHAIQIGLTMTFEETSLRTQEDMGL